MTIGVERVVTLQKKRGTVNVERLTTLRDARTAWHELLLSPLSSLLTTSQPYNLITLKPYAKQITCLEANPANRHHRAYRYRHYFWGAVVPLS